MDAGDVGWLRSPAGIEATAEATALLDGGAGELRTSEVLRRRWSPGQARAVLALVEGRRAAAAKFADAGSLYCDREAAEQATSEVVASHTAARFAWADRVADLGCGMGGDALALATHAEVLAVDRDPGRLAMLQANAAVRGLGGRVQALRGEVEDLAIPAGVDAAWLDPSRRDASGRTLDPEGWSPRLSRAIEVVGRFEGAGIKVAPGIDLAVAPGDAEVEFISLEGRLVEAVLWFGRCVTAPRRATVLPSGDSLAGEPDRGAAVLGKPRGWLYDPDPAVGRARLVELLARGLDARWLDADVAYLLSDRAQSSPFARRFRIEASLPFSERALTSRLRALGAARVEVMRRASPVDTNALEVRLNRRLDGDGGIRTVVLTRVAGEHTAIIAVRERDEDER